MSICRHALQDSRLPAERLLSSLEKFEFCINLHALAATSGLLISISRSLQMVGTDIIKALDETKGVADILANMRRNSEESFGKIMDDAVTMANDMNIAVNKPRVAKRSVYRAGAVNDDDESVSNYYRINMYILLLDGLCSHLTDRFGPAHQKVLSDGVKSGIHDK